MSELECANCGGTYLVRARSFDLDLPAVLLCGVCAVLIWKDPALFAEQGRRMAEE